MPPRSERQGTMLGVEKAHIALLSCQAIARKEVELPTDSIYRN
jgi:hypothetical protein